MSKNIKIILIILGIFLISFLFFYFVKGATTTWETTYPVVGGEEITSEEDLPGYILYVFNFAFLAAGVLAFILLIYGGFRYVTSAGNPTIMKDAKDQIISVIIGIVVLLGSYLILVEINPSDFEKIQVEKMEKVTGIYLMNSANDKNKLYYARSTPMINADFSFSQIEFINLSEELDSVFTFSEPYFQGTVKKIENKKEDAEDTSISPISSGTKSIRFKWDMPGVYLMGENLGEEILLTGNVSDLGRYYFKGKTKEIELKNDVDENNDKITDYRAITHKERDFEGICQIFNKSGNNEILDFSSINVFEKREEIISSTITLFPLPNYQEYEGNEEMGEAPISKEDYAGEMITPTKIPEELEENVRSIIIPPGYLVVLFEKKPTGTNPLAPIGTECQVFTKNNPDLTKELIGQCSGVSILGTGQWNFKPCATYISIYAIK